MGAFDPYLIWLDIPPHERPVNHYRLLGLRPLEGDPQVISAAADRAAAHVSQYQNTAQAAACHQLLAEIQAARACLLDPMRKAAYDSGLAPTGRPHERAVAPPPSPMPRPAPPGEGFVPQPGASAPYQPDQPVAATPPAPSSLQAHGPSSGERQIAQSPPVPGAAPASQTPPPAGGVQPMPGPAALPRSVQQIPANPEVQPATGGEVALPPSAVAGGGSTWSATPAAMPQPQAAQPTPDAPPAWASGQRTGQVGMVTASAADPQQIATERPAHGRLRRRQKQSHYAYLLVACAMAMMVFFFGAVLLLAIYLSR